MQLLVTTLSEIVLDEPVHQVVAEGPDGSFCFLPQHVDWVMALIPGIITVHRHDGAELFLATGAGLLVKQADQVRIATREATASAELDALLGQVAETFAQRKSTEQRSRGLLSRLEMGFMRQFIDLKEPT